MKKKGTVMLAVLVLVCFAFVFISDLNTEIIEIPTEFINEDTILGDLDEVGIPLSNTPFEDMFLEATAPGTKVKSNSRALIDYSNATDGYVMVKWLEGGSTKIMARVQCPDDTIYTYNMNTDGNYEVFPLSEGNGKYLVKVYKSTGNGNKYAVVLSLTIDNLEIKDEFAPFIRPNQYVNYTKDSETIKKATELCEDIDDNLKKTEAVYKFVIDNLTYDKEKAADISAGKVKGYLPVLDSVLKSKKGICFDYASLMAGMLRSQGVPVKLVVGYTGKAYHAWVNVWSEETGWVNAKIYFDGETWELMDPTFASSNKESDTIMKYIGTGSNYTAKYVY